MSADASAARTLREEPPPAPAATPGPLTGDPAALGLPCFVAGSVSLGLALVGVVPATAIGAALPIILTATSIGLFLATIWSASLGQTAVARKCVRHLRRVLGSATPCFVAIGLHP